jgi:Asp-tRNA(Asn)/Glu-tRNA(Gln) amidotransferase A subunit family amidase
VGAYSREFSRHERDDPREWGSCFKAQVPPPPRCTASVTEATGATRPAARHDCGVSDPQSAREAVKTSLARLRALHEVTNCVAAWNDEEALARADVLDRAWERDGPVGPLHGLPITVKDWIDVAGLPCTGGYVECRDRMPEADATVVARMRAAGAIVLAKTTVFEDSAIFGPVRHPRDPTRS